MTDLVSPFMNSQMRKRITKIDMGGKTTIGRAGDSPTDNSSQGGAR
jgi:hypothetical protein